MNEHWPDIHFRFFQGSPSLISQVGVEESV
jgi:hypothetical protein